MNILNQENGVLVMSTNSQLSLTFRLDGKSSSGLTFKEAGIPLYEAKRVR